MIKFQIIATVFLMFTCDAFAAAGHDALRAGGFHSYNSGGGSSSSNDNDNDHIEVSVNKTPAKTVWGAFKINRDKIGLVVPNGYRIPPGNQNTILPGSRPGGAGGGSKGYQEEFEPKDDDFDPFSMRKLDNRVTYSKGKKKSKRGKAEAKAVKLAIKHYTKGMSKKKKRKFKRKITFVFYEFGPE